MLYRALRRSTILKALLGREPFHLPQGSWDLEFHGSSYGGWSILRDSLNSKSNVYSVGIGEDPSFDLSLIAKYGCRVLAYDPTPRAVRWVERHVTNPLFVMHALALADHDGDLRLFLPLPISADPVSASMYPSASANEPISVPCRTLGSLLSECPQRNCDLLKMDIEGAEYGVIRQAAAEGWLEGTKQLLVEFHHWVPGIGVATTLEAVRTLRAIGFCIAWVSRTNHEYLFIRAC